MSSPSSNKNNSSSSSVAYSTPVAIDAVPGLYVCTEFFSPAVEPSLYFDPLLFPDSPAEIERLIIQKADQQQQQMEDEEGKKKKKKKLDRWLTPMHAFQTPHMIPTLLKKVCNGITESGLCAEFIAPDYCLPISYPAPHGQFFYHYDSRYRWGETVVGITLGTGGIMGFQPQTKKSKGNPPFVGKRIINNQGLVVEIRETNGGKSFIVDVHLPPRSVYVMSGDCRTDWKHAVHVNNEKHRNAVVSSKTNPSFWDCTMRRTITLRSTKVFSDEVLTRLLRATTSNNSAIQARFTKQAKWRPQGDYGGNVIDDAELLERRQRAVRNVNMVQQTFQNVFLSDRERGYVRRFPGQSCWPLMQSVGSIGGGNQAPSSSPSATQLSASDLRAKRLAFYGGDAAAAAADTSSPAGCAGSSNQKKRKQPPPAAAPAAAAVAAHSAATAIDLLGDSSSDEEDCKPVAIQKKSPPPTKSNNRASVEIVEID